MAQGEQQLHALVSTGRKSVVSAWMILGVFAVIGGLCMTLALADEAVYLRATMPLDAAESLQPQADDESDGGNALEQRLIERLFEDPQHAAFETVQDDRQWRVVQMRVTAYCPCSICCGKFSDGVTACNHTIRPGDVFVAADKRYRFGTEMLVPGYNNNQPVEVKDRGRVIKGNRLDVFFDSHETAKQWGTRTLDVRVRPQ